MKKKGGFCFFASASKIANDRGEIVPVINTNDNSDTGSTVLIDKTEYELLQKELSEVSAILSGDAGNKSLFH